MILTDIYPVIIIIANKTTVSDRSLSGDLASEIYIALGRMPAERLQLLYEENEIEAYIARMAYKMFHYHHGYFYKTYRRSCPVQPEYEQEDSFEELTETVNKLHWYEEKILGLYLEFGTIQKVSDYTRINYESIKKTLQKIKKTVKKNYECIVNIPISRAA